MLVYVVLVCVSAGLVCVVLVLGWCVLVRVGAGLLEGCVGVCWCWVVLVCVVLVCVGAGLLEGFTDSCCFFAGFLYRTMCGAHEAGPGAHPGEAPLVLHSGLSVTSVNIFSWFHLLTFQWFFLSNIVLFNKRYNTFSQPIQTTEELHNNEILEILRKR